MPIKPPFDLLSLVKVRTIKIDYMNEYLIHTHIEIFSIYALNKISMFKTVKSCQLRLSRSFS